METTDKNGQINPAIFKIRDDIFWDVLVCRWAAVPDVSKDHIAFILTHCGPVFFPLYLSQIINSK
jgi:hypothetical protein